MSHWNGIYAASIGILCLTQGLLAGQEMQQFKNTDFETKYTSNWTTKPGKRSVEFISPSGKTHIIVGFMAAPAPVEVSQDPERFRSHVAQVLLKDVVSMPGSQVIGNGVSTDLNVAMGDENGIYVLYEVFLGRQKLRYSITAVPRRDGFFGVIEIAKAARDMPYEDTYAAYPRTRDSTRFFDDDSRLSPKPTLLGTWERFETMSIGARPHAIIRLTFREGGTYSYSGERGGFDSPLYNLRGSGTYKAESGRLHFSGDANRPASFEFRRARLEISEGLLGGSYQLVEANSQAQAPRNTPVVANVPSGFKTYQTPWYAMDYPGDWTARPVKQDSSGSIVAADGVIKGTNGTEDIAHGVLLSMTKPQSADIEIATAALLKEIIKNNPSMGSFGASQSRKVDGYPARLTHLRSPKSHMRDSDQEYVLLLTVMHEKGMFYGVFIAPESRWRVAEPEYQQMISSVRITR